MSEEILIKALRQKISEQVPRQIGEVQKVSRDEALTEAEYIFKKQLMESRPRNLEEANTILQNTFKMIYAYFKSLGYNIPPEELINHIISR